MASLFVIQGRDQGSRFPLEESIHSIGRTQTNTIRLHDTEVSRNHAELIRRGDSYVLRDTGSSNGTYVNGQMVAERALLTGDQIQVGSSLLLYTGFHDDAPEDLADLVDIVPLAGDHGGSRIVASLSQTGGSEWLMPDARGSSNPFISQARSNLQIMYRTALAVSHTLDIDQLLKRIMDLIFDWVDADRGCIMMKNLETGRLDPKVRRHRRGSQEEKITISKTILDYVQDRREGVLTSNARDDARWDPAQSIVNLGVREAICVPMQGRYDVVGVIYIDTTSTPQRVLANKSANQFTEEHLRLMIAIAHQAALAVEDTSYYKALVQAERLAAVGQAIASLSHHIKNILQGVRGGSYLIELGLNAHDRATTEESEADDGDAVSAVDTIRKGWGIVERNQERISALVLDMLTFSKEREPEPQPANLNEVAADVVELMQSRAADLGVELIYQPDERMPQLMFDPEGLHRAVLNIVTNAIDACDEAESGRVSVSTRYDEPLAKAFVVVQDNGAGIAPDDVEAIFTAFVSRKGGRGTGLGLPVSRKIVEEHGGQIAVASTLGHGSCFTLELPATLVDDDAEIDPRLRATQSIPNEDEGG
ncbi:MAG: FHA domain-containing protein [Pirellulales bacterium]|nr:FHA domain-containing protein [Pirellulales bacterium]